MRQANRRSEMWLAVAFAAAALGWGCSSESEHAGGGGAGTGASGGSPPVDFASCSEAFAEDDSCPAASGRTFYVSSTSGSDQNGGLSDTAPLATIAAVNALDLGPGDHVLFRCGDTWRGEMLTITRSGAACQHVVFGSYPERTCDDQPTLSGSQPVSGWVDQGGGIWAADLAAGANAGLFPQGLNQLFRGGERLSLGRWPNADDPAFGHGYATIDTQPNATTISDAELLPGDLTGAVVRLKTFRWLLLSRQVVGSSAGTLVLNDAVECWGGSCGDPNPGDPADHGWGYLVTNHFATLDQEGEWFYDAAAGRLYLVSASEPTGVEGSAVPDWVAEDSDWTHTGGVILGHNLQEHVTHVVVENLRIENWFSSGITTPINLELDEDSALEIRCNTIRNVESRGLNLATWVWNAGDASGWRGGHDLVVVNNLIDGPNHYGIHSYARQATFQGNVVRNVGLAENLGASGLGCGFEGSNCTENGDGIHVVIDQPDWSSYAVTFRENRVEGSGYCGFDLFGRDVTLENNVITRACSTKGDCGAVRTFGRDSFGATPVRDIALVGNVILGVEGVTDGDATPFETLFGFGLYIDNYSATVSATGNTVTGATVAAILYQNSQGSIRDNVLYDNGGAAVAIVGESTVDALQGNVLYALETSSGTLALEGSTTLLASDGNAFFAPWDPNSIHAGGPGLGLAAWQAQSGLDASSTEAWFGQAAGEAPRSALFVNDGPAATSVPLGASYVDLDQVPAPDPLTLAPYASAVLVTP